MKKMMKTLFVSIASLSLMISAKAGELTVNGSAKMTYNATSGQNVDNGIGISNELNFTASGELDNGYTWTYSMELDPASSDSGQANNDDTAITVSGDMGTVKVCVSECGNNAKYAFDASAYGAMSDTSLSEGIVYPDDEGSHNSLQYHSPELPFGTTVSVSYGQVKLDGSSSNAQGTTSGDSIEAYSVTTKPIDGLTVKASYYDKNDYDDGLTNEQQLEDGGAYGAKYSIGNVTLGYGKSFKSPESTTAVSDGTVVEYYENTGISFAYSMNDNLVLSYTIEDSEAVQRTSTNTTYDIEMTSLQAAYTVGGATVSLARTDYENIGYADGVDAEETIVAVAFAF